MRLIRTAVSMYYHMKLDIKNNTKLHINAYNILITIHKFQSKNTCKAYGPKQNEFKIDR